MGFHLISGETRESKTDGFAFLKYVPCDEARDSCLTCTDAVASREKAEEIQVKKCFSTDDMFADG